MRGGVVSVRFLMMSPTTDGANNDTGNLKRSHVQCPGTSEYVPGTPSTNYTGNRYHNMIRAPGGTMFMSRIHGRASARVRRTTFNEYSYPSHSNCYLVIK